MSLKKKLKKNPAESEKIEKFTATQIAAHLT